jgi:hypothetical protein
MEQQSKQGLPAGTRTERQEPCLAHMKPKGAFLELFDCICDAVAAGMHAGKSF